MSSNYLRREFLENEASQTSDSTTYKLKLPKTGMIPALMLKLKATNGSTSNKNCAIKDVLTRVELIGNGSTPLFSLTGDELDRYTWKFLKKRPSELLSEANDAVQYQTFYLMFGRALDDKDYGLDLSKWNDLELKIQYNLAAVNAVGASGFVSGSFNVTCIAYRYPQSASVIPRGYIKTTEIVQPTDTASGEKRYELPIANKLLEIGLYCREDAIADDTDVTKFNIELESGSEILFAGNWDDIQQENSNLMGINGRQSKTFLKSDTDTLDFETGVVKNYDVKFVKDVSIVNNTFEVLQVDTIAGDRLTLNASTCDVTAGTEDLTAFTTDTKIMAAVDGDGVGNMVFYPFSRMKDFSDALDSQRHGKIEAVLTHGASGATLGLVLSELVSKQGA